MRILHVLDHSIPLQSGYTFRTRAIIQHQRAKGWETFHVTSPKHAAAGAVESAAVEDVDNLTFYRSPPLSSLITRIPILNQLAISAQLARRVAAVVEEVKPDILHAHSPALNGLAAWWVARKFDLPLVYEVRAFWEDAAVDHGTSQEWGLRYRLTRGLESFILNRASAVTTICEGLRQEMVGRGVSEGKITVIPNAVDLNSFTADLQKDTGLQAEMGLGDKTVLGFVGSFYAYEGLSLLVEALAKLADTNPSLHLLLVGGGPQDTALKQQVQDLGLSERVTFTGRVPHDQVQRYYSLVDILVYPRLPMRLTDLVTPLKPLEAMAQNKLMIASDVGGHRELIRDGENGVLFRSGDVQALAQAIEHLSGNTESWQGLRAAGRNYVEQERNWPKSVDRYAAVYQSI